jgi:hypothetical protein
MYQLRGKDDQDGSVTGSWNTTDQEQQEEKSSSAAGCSQSIHCMQVAIVSLKVFAVSI